MLTIEITAPRVSCAHCARRAARSAERCNIRMFWMFDIVSVNLFERWQEYTFIHWGWLKGKP